MNKFVSLALLALATTLCAAAQQQAQSPSLGDVARKQRAEDKAAPAHKVWTNEDFNDQAAPAAPPSDQAKGDHAAAKDEKGDDTKAKQPPDPVGDQAKLNQEWKGKLDAQKAKIADLQHDYDLTDREYKIAATSYYADAGNRLRDPKDFHDKETGYREKLDKLKQQISDEQAKLSEMQEQAHKAGANKAYD
jgi:hypothetical protein